MHECHTQDGFTHAQTQHTSSAPNSSLWPHSRSPSRDTMTYKKMLTHQAWELAEGQGLGARSCTRALREAATMLLTVVGLVGLACERVLRRFG